jgi:hypothetical protein
VIVAVLPLMVTVPLLNTSLLAKPVGAPSTSSMVMLLDGDSV